VISGNAAHGMTVWFTGLPSAGKSSIAAALAARLRLQLHGAGRPVEVLDGDELRRTVSAGLGFSRADREENVRRIGLLAVGLAREGAVVLVPVIAPYADSRAGVRRLHRTAGVPYLEVHVATPVEVCARRDVKGLYARQAAGELVGLTGVDDPYEVPVSPELRVETVGLAVGTSAGAVYRLLVERGIVQRGVA
jgi:adenylylsulfate kinase